MATLGGLRQAALVASAARTTSSNAVVPLGDDYTRATYLLDVTATSSAAGDKLNVYVQRTPDEGTTWDDLLHFTEVLGTTGAVKHIAQWNGYDAVERELGTPQDAAMSAGVYQGGILGPQLRVKWVVTNGGGSHSFTFSVSAMLSDS